jgi:excisionase family DNA binding protein
MPSYTTREASIRLGISFVTVKRWIYSGKLKATKDSRGWWRIDEKEIQRLRTELEKKSASRAIDDKVLGLISSKRVAYLRELQICLEEDYLHKDTYATLKRLVPKKLNTTSKFGNRWYFSKSNVWGDVEELAKEKQSLMECYAKHPRRFEKDGIVYMDYSEFLLEKALLLAGYTIVAKDTYYFNGIAYRESNTAGRPRDLDFIVKVPKKEVFLGIQVKNKTKHPTFAEVSYLLDICRSLHLRPILIARIIHPATYNMLKNNGGWALRFKRYFLQPPFPRDKFPEIVNMGIPLGVYKRCPEFLVGMLGSLGRIF